MVHLCQKKFNAKLTPHSSRAYLGGGGRNDWVRPALHLDLYRYALLLPLLGLCKPGRAHLGSQILKFDLACARRVEILSDYGVPSCPSG